MQFKQENLMKMTFPLLTLSKYVYFYQKNEHLKKKQFSKIRLISNENRTHRLLVSVADLNSLKDEEELSGPTGPVGLFITGDTPVRIHRLLENFT